MTFVIAHNLVGTEVDNVVWPPVTVAEILEYAAACGETNPLFTDEEAARRGPFGTLIAPPTFVIRSRMPHLRQRLPELSRPGLHAGEEIDFGDPVRSGDVLASRTIVHDVYRKTGRSGVLHFIVLHTTVTNQHGRLVANIEQRMMFR